MKDTYTKAVLDLLATGAEVTTVATGLTRVLKARGHDRLAMPIWRAVLRTLRAGADNQAVVYIDSIADVSAYQAEIKALLTTLQGGTSFTTQIDPTLIGGYIVEANKQRVDRSYKNHLLTLYRSITT